jgi:ABC-type polysaccharide/polyol phosphate transport system ATPase subunit
MTIIRADRISLSLPMLTAKRLSNDAEHRYILRNGKPFIRALDEISFTAKAGDRIGIIGRNGSGKTTLMRVIAGIYATDSGVLEVDGKISCLFNINMGMQMELSGRDNIFIRGIIAGQSNAQIAAKLDEIVAFAELENFINLPLRTYSAGMVTRLAFAISTAFSPEILLLDEWIGAGDAEFQKKAAARMHSLLDEAAITILASHNRGLLSKVCSALIWLHEGQLMSMGAVEETYRLHDKFYEL